MEVSVLDERKTSYPYFWRGMARKPVLLARKPENQSKTNFQEECRGSLYFWRREKKNVVTQPEMRKLHSSNRKD
jgi:hypothetical protein